jgi:hypothetical protein
VTEEEPAKASVVLRLKANRPLGAATVKGIAGLVSGSVESLRPESVTILDTNGRFLSRPAEESTNAGSAAQFERQQQIERDLANKVISLLEPAVGAGRVRVNVAAVLNANLTEETEERFESGERRAKPNDLDGDVRVGARGRRNCRRARQSASGAFDVGGLRKRGRSCPCGRRTGCGRRASNAATSAKTGTGERVSGCRAATQSLSRGTVVRNDQLRSRPDDPSYRDRSRPGFASIARRDRG